MSKVMKTLIETLERRLGELAIGLMAMIYGFHATQPGWSQFQKILWLRSYSQVFGLILFAAGVSAICFATAPEHWKIRIFVHSILALLWALIILMFFNSREFGLPVFSGITLIFLSVVVITYITHNEKQARHSCNHHR